jgi:oligosaccharide translocation protein RFT1
MVVLMHLRSIMVSSLNLTETRIMTIITGTFIGSLIVRILFQPLEETGRTFFSKLLVSEDEKSDKKVSLARQTTASNVLMILIKFHVLLGLVFICFATNYSSTLIDLLAGSKWSIKSNAPVVLAMYCIYVPFMGINGITEGFVQAVATKQDLTSLSYFMILFSACFITSGFFFMYWLQMGAIGLILANMVNLGIRIGYSWYFISNYFKSGVTISVKQWFPHVTTFTAFVLAWLITLWSKNNIGWYTFNQKLLHIAVGGICFILVAAIT